MFFLFLFGLFAIIGSIYVMTFIHEYAHYKDFEGYVFDGDICIMGFPANQTSFQQFQNIGGFYSYSFNIDNGNYEKVMSIKKTSEVKASITTGILIFIFAICFLVYLRLCIDVYLEERDF